MTRNHRRGTDDVADLITIYEDLSPALWGMTGLAGRFGWPGLARDLGVSGWRVTWLGVVLARGVSAFLSGAWGWVSVFGFSIYMSPLFWGLLCWSDGVTVCISAGQSLYLTGIAPLC